MCLQDQVIKKHSLVVKNALELKQKKENCFQRRIPNTTKSQHTKTSRLSRTSKLFEIISKASDVKHAQLLQMLNETRGVLAFVKSVYDCNMFVLKDWKCHDP